MPQRKQEIPQPFKGLIDLISFSQFPQGATLDCLNVVPFDPVTGRMRISQRAGTGRAVEQQVAGHNPIQRMGQITLQAGEFLGPAGQGDDWFDGEGDPQVWGWPDYEYEEEIDLESGELSLVSVSNPTVTLQYDGASGGVRPYVYTLQLAAGDGEFEDSEAEVSPPEDIVAADLQPDTEYQARVRVEDFVGQEAFTNEVGFMTPEAPDNELQEVQWDGKSTTVFYQFTAPSDWEAPITHTLERRENGSWVEAGPITPNENHVDTHDDSDLFKDGKLEYRVVSEDSSDPQNTETHGLEIDADLVVVVDSPTFIGDACVSNPIGGVEGARLIDPPDIGQTYRLRHREALGDFLGDAPQTADPFDGIVNIYSADDCFGDPQSVEEGYVVRAVIHPDFTFSLQIAGYERDAWKFFFHRDTEYQWHSELGPQVFEQVEPAGETFAWSSGGTATLYTIKQAIAAGITVPDLDEFDDLSAGVLTVDSTTDTSVTLAYGETAGGLPPYTRTIQRQDGASWVDEGAIGENDTAEVSDLDPETEYTFRVRVVDDGGTEAFSNEVQATTDEAAAALSAGTLSVTDKSSTTVTLDYTAPSGGDPPYTNTVQREGSFGIWFDEGEITPGTPFTVEELNPDTQYTFRVETEDDAENVDHSNEVTETTDP